MYVLKLKGQCSKGKNETKIKCDPYLIHLELATFETYIYIIIIIIKCPNLERKEKGLFGCEIQQAGAISHIGLACLDKHFHHHWSWISFFFHGFNLRRKN